MTSQDVMEIIKTRRSVRTFDGRKISSEHREKLKDYIKDIKNPYNIPVRFVLLEGNKSQDICSPVIEGEDLYVAAMIPNVPHSEEAFGFSVPSTSMKNTPNRLPALHHGMCKK